VVDASPDLVDPNFINLIDELPVSEQYTFIFEGTPQVLDHVIINTVANARKTRIAIARNNADFPELPAAAFASNAARPERNSDHDMPVAYFSLVVAPPTSALIISEFRFRGPNAAQDEFVELYNNTDADITVSTTDGSAGWALVGSDGTARFVIPNGTIIPARGHYLGTNSAGYSLNNYGGTGAADGDNTYTADIADNSGIALFRTSNSANFTLAERLDAAGYTTAPALYREGAGFPTGGAETTGNLEYSFFRDYRNGGTGFPRDSGDNAADFLSVDTAATLGLGLGQRLGAPGPENLSSPIQRSSVFPVVNIDPQASTAASPNRVRTQCGSAPECNPTTAQFGTISIRRTVTNNSGAPITRLRFRVVEITTFPRPNATDADVRVLSSSNTTVTLTGGAQVPVSGTTLEQPPTQPLGGGWNSSLLTGTIDFSNPLPDGESVNVQFLLGVQQTGNFRFFIKVEAGDEPIGVVAAAPDNQRPPRR